MLQGLSKGSVPNSQSRLDLSFLCKNAEDKKEVFSILKDLESNIIDGCKLFDEQTLNLVVKQTTLETFLDKANDFGVTRDYIEFIVNNRFFPIMRDIKIAEAFIASKDVIQLGKKMFMMQGVAKFRYFKAFYDVVTYFGSAILMERDASYMPPKMLCDLVFDICEDSIKKHPNFEKDKRSILYVFLIQLGLESLAVYRSYVEKLIDLKSRGQVTPSIFDGKVLDLISVFRYDLDELEECAQKGILTKEEFEKIESNYFSEIEDVLVDWFDDLGTRFAIFQLLEKASKLIDGMSVEIPEDHLFKNLAEKKAEYSKAMTSLTEIKQVHELALLVNTRVSDCFRRGDNINGIMSSTLEYIRNRLKGEDWKFISGFIALDAIFISACRELLKDGNRVYKREEVFDFFNRSLEFYAKFFEDLNEGRFVCENAVVKEYLHLPLVSGLSKAVAISRFRTTFRLENQSLKIKIEDLELGIHAHELMRDVMNYFARQNEKYKIETFATVQEDERYKVLLIMSAVEIGYVKNKKKKFVSTLSGEFNKYIDVMRSELAKLKRELVSMQKAESEQEKQKAELLAKYEKGFEDILKVFEDSSSSSNKRLEEQIQRVSKSSFTPKKAATIVDMITDAAEKFEAREQTFQLQYESFFEFLNIELKSFKASFAKVLRDEKIKLGKDPKRFFVPFLGSFNSKLLSDEIDIFDSKLNNLIEQIDSAITEHSSAFQNFKVLHLKVLKADLFLICGLTMISLHERSKGIDYLKKAVEKVLEVEELYNTTLQQEKFSSGDDVKSLYEKISMCKAGVFDSHTSAVLEHRDFLAKLKVYREKAKQKLGDKWLSEKKEVSPEAKFFREMKKLETDLLSVETNRLLQTVPLAPVMYLMPLSSVHLRVEEKNFAKMSFDDMALLKPKTFKPSHTKSFEPYGKEEILKRFESKESAIGFIRQ